MADLGVANDRNPTSSSPLLSPAAPPHPVGNHGGSVAPGEGSAVDLLRVEFAPRISAARAKFTSAVDAMRDAAEAMRGDGRPPSYRLLHALGECHREFLRLRHDVTGRARALSWPLPPPETLIGIGDLDRLLDFPPGDLSPPSDVAPAVPPHSTVEPVETPAATNGAVETSQVDRPESVETIPPVPVEAAPVIEVLPPVNVETPEPDVPEVTAPAEGPEHPGETVRRSALAVIDTVLRLVARDGSASPPLSDCQAMALALRERVAASPPSELPGEAAELAGGTHELAGLLTVVSGAGSMSDAEWASLHARVSEAFGRPLAIAAARGRLRVEPPG